MSAPAKILILPLFFGACFSLFADVKLSSDGKAKLAIHVPEADNKSISQTAKQLKTYLDKITDANISIKTELIQDKGILLSRSQSVSFTDKDIAKLGQMGPEAYLIKVSGGKILLVGNSVKAVKDASFDFLETLGCRWLVPGERWTVVPANKDISVKDSVKITQPDFAYRSIWYAYGMGIDESKKILSRDYQLWFDANRLGGVARYKCGHSYPATVGRHEAEFKAHPEYFAMDKDGKRIPFSKYKSLCYSNPDVAAIFLKDKINELRRDKQANAYAYTVSMDPNDGSVPCYCEKCRALGNGSDQALYLANKVAKGIKKTFPDAVVTLYVYASHRLPPEKIKAEPNVNVQVAMGFNKTKYSLPELVALWKKKVSAFGIRDYFGVMAWDWGLPGRGKASNFQYVKRWLPTYKSWNATSFNAEINANWGTFGPATSVATRLLWDTQTDAENAYDDYLAKAFGAAAGRMKELYRHWQESQQLSQGNLNLWLTTLEQAFKAAAGDSEQVKQRLVDMAAYLHYVVLFKDWGDAKQTKNQEACYAAVRKLLEYTWQIRKRQMVHSYALQRRLVNSGDPVLRPLRKGWRFNDPHAVWKKAGKLTDQEILELFRKDLLAYPPDARIKRFSTELKKRTTTKKSPYSKGALRYKSVWHILVEQNDPLKLKLPCSGVRFNYTIEIFSRNGDLVWTASHGVKSGGRYEMQDFAVDLVFPKPGQYRIIIHAGEDYRPCFPEGINAVVDCSERFHTMFRFFGRSYFYVPRGTRNILLKTDGRLSIIAPSWKQRKDILPRDEDQKLNCNRIPVGDDGGKIWTILPSTSARFYFLNIPPYVSPSAQQLLIPSDIEGQP